MLVGRRRVRRVGGSIPARVGVQTKKFAYSYFFRWREAPGALPDDKGVRIRFSSLWRTRGCTTESAADLISRATPHARSDHIGITGYVLPGGTQPIMSSHRGHNRPQNLVSRGLTPVMSLYRGHNGLRHEGMRSHVEAMRSSANPTFCTDSRFRRSETCEKSNGAGSERTESAYPRTDVEHRPAGREVARRYFSPSCSAALSTQERALRLLG